MPNYGTTYTVAKSASKLKTKAQGYTYTAKSASKLKTKAQRYIQWQSQLKTKLHKGISIINAHPNAINSHQDTMARSQLTTLNW